MSCAKQRNRIEVKLNGNDRKCSHFICPWMILGINGKMKRDESNKMIEVYNLLCGMKKTVKNENDKRIFCTNIISARVTYKYSMKVAYFFFLEMLMDFGFCDWEIEWRKEKYTNELVVEVCGVKA